MAVRRLLLQRCEQAAHRLVLEVGSGLEDKLVGGKLVGDKLVGDRLAYRAAAWDKLVGDMHRAAGSASVTGVDIGREETVLVDTYRAAGEDKRREGTDQEAFGRAASRGSQVTYLN